MEVAHIIATLDHKLKLAWTHAGEYCMAASALLTLAQGRDEILVIF